MGLSASVDLRTEDAPHPTPDTTRQMDHFD
jgi:hypothetical protein